MDKSPDAFRTISEVADLLETPAHVLRFWESRFPQIKPVKRAGGRRYYRPVDVALIAGIRRLLHDEGMTIRGVQKILREQGVRFVSGLADASEEDLHAASEADFIEVAEDGSTPAPPDPDPPAEIVSLAGWRAQPASAAPETTPPRQTSLFDLPPFAAPAPLDAPKAETDPSDLPPLPEDMTPVSEVPVDLEGPESSVETPPLASTPLAIESPMEVQPAEPVAESLEDPGASLEESRPAEGSLPSTTESALSEPPAPLVWIPTKIRALPAASRAAKAEVLAPLTQRLKALHDRLDAARGPRRR